MDIETFVSKSLVQIYNGVKKAAEELQMNMAFAVDTERKTVTFDIAVLAEKATEVKGGAGGGVKLLVAEVGSNIGINQSEKSTATNRVQFSVRFIIPELPKTGPSQ